MKKSTIFMVGISFFCGAVAGIVLDPSDLMPYFAGVLVGGIAIGGCGIIDLMEESS